MASRTDFSRSAILRRRTPSKREKKEKKEKKEKSRELTPEPDNVLPSQPQETDETEVTLHEYSINLILKMNNLVDKKWKKRDPARYRTGMLMKISALIDNNGWKWWKGTVKDSSTKIDALLKLVELYQFIVTYMLAEDSKSIPENDSRPKNVSNELLTEMISDVLAENVGYVLLKLYSIARERKVDLDYLNLITTTSRHIRALPGYVTGEYIPIAYVDNDIEIADRCFEHYSDPEATVEAVYELFRIPRNERILLQ